MAIIYFNSLNKNLKKAIYSKSISSDDLKKIYEEFKEKNKKKQKTLNIVMVCVAFMFILIEVLSFSKAKNAEFAKIMLLFTIPLLAIIYLIVYFTQIGLIKIQFNNAIKKNYPELANELKI